MKLRITLKDLFNLPGSEIVNPVLYKSVRKVSIDSRKIEKNCLFIAIKGEKFDGHDFIRDAVKNGASAIVIEQERYSQFEDLNIPVVLVEDTTKAFGYLAYLWRNKLRIKVISLTGSAGKTTTKDMIATLLSEKFCVNKTLANYNNHIGVPLTIFSTSRKHEILVLEHGTNHFGEIAYTAEIAQPDYALITNIGYSHLEFLKNRRGVLKEKISLFETAAKRKGTLFINNDDVLLSQYNDYRRKVSFGTGKDSDVRGRIIKYTDDGRPVIELRYKKEKVRTEFNLYGEQSFRNLLAASSVAFKLGLKKKQILKGIRKLTSPDKRLNVSDFGSFLLIDDTYNANPDSMRSSLELLSRIKIHKRKIAILGDMFELGKTSRQHHKKLAGFIKRKKIDEVYAVGEMMKSAGTELKKSLVEFRHFPERELLSEFIAGKDFSGSVILVKGSRGMKMEEFVQKIREKIS